MIKRALVFQHMEDEPPGLYGEFLEGQGAQLDIRHLYRGDQIPDLGGYDLLLVMGGAMDVWEKDQYRWLSAEVAAIREWTIARNRPYFGVCLGLQLLAEAMGGEVGKARAQEVGVMDVALTKLGRRHPHEQGAQAVDEGDAVASRRGGAGTRGSRSAGVLAGNANSDHGGRLAHPRNPVPWRTDAGTDRPLGGYSAIHRPGSKRRTGRVPTTKWSPTSCRRLQPCGR